LLPYAEQEISNRENTMRSVPLVIPIILCQALLLPHWTQAQEMPGMTSQQMPQHQAHGAMHSVEPVYPQMGRAQAQQQGHTTLFTLDEAQREAKESNPTLRQAEAEIRASKARRLQAGLYPNPTVGYAGDEIRGGSVNGGKQGFFVQQNIVTGGKLEKSRDVFLKETRIAEIEAEEQKIRVESAVKAAYFRVLAAQELLDARRDLAKIEVDYVDMQRRLFNTGQADETELLESEVDSQRMQIAVRMQENTLREEWRALAAVIGKPELEMAVVQGDLEHNWPELNEQQVVETIATQSPATRIADASDQRALSEIIRAKRETLPDLQLRAGMEYNREPLGPGSPLTGWEGIAEVGVQLPIFNRNQGNVAAASADRDRSQLEKQRITLMLRERAATIVDQYANAKLMAVEYRDEILPRAKKAYSLMVEKYGLMLAAPPRVIETQRKLFQLQTEYIAALESVWTTGISLQSYLLTDGLEAPARPTEVDRPIRETNVPMPERIQSLP
jgi:cobalt-zinc-cadmium efflux system outer membrane protein